MRGGKEALWNIVCRASTIGMGVAFLWHFFSILRHHQVLIQEDNIAVLAIEVAMVTGVVALAMIYLIRGIRRPS
jgi:hypothetical protein